MKEIEIKTPVGLYRFTPEPGEVFVLKVDAILTDHAADHIKRMWDSKCPGVPLVIPEKRAHLGVIKP